MTTTHRHPTAAATSTKNSKTPASVQRAGDCGCDDHCACDPPRALQRNAFFPHKLMEVRHWQAEQRYHRSSRELVTRLGLGSGVLCGLAVEQTSAGGLVLHRGAGVDGHGRIVVVPRDVEVDPSRLTDCCGRVAGDPVEAGAVTVSLCYHECGTDLVAMPPESCDGEPVCVPAMVREAFSVTVTEGRTVRSSLPADVCRAVLHGRTHEKEDDEDDKDEHHLDHEARRLLLDELYPRECGCDEDCIPLAVVQLGGEQGPVLDTGVRTMIRSNRELLDLILCLADRVDACCRGTTVTHPPRITDLWPWPDNEGFALGQFAEHQRLELAFDRDLAEQGLDDPAPWLGVWLLDQRGATRLRATRAAGALEHVTVPPGGEGAAYALEFPHQEVGEGALIVVMARSTSPGPIRAAGSDQLALDPDLAATGLSPQQREQLWALPPMSVEPSLDVLAADAVTGPSPSLPTGDGTAGGELHLVLRPALEVVPAPQLIAVWPPGASVLQRDSEGSARENWERWLERPQLELTVSRAIAETALATPRAWLGLWSMVADGDHMYAVTEIGLDAGATTDRADGTVQCTFAIQPPPDWHGVATFLVQLRSTAPLVAASPVGRDEPQVLLDANVTGTVLDSHTLYQIWMGDPFPNGIPWGPPSPTTGTQLFDGTEGGLAHWAFTVERP